MSAAGNRLLILVGSPKPLERSASARLGKIVGEALSARGWELRTVRIPDALKSEASIESMLSEVERADGVVLTAPLYVDSLPAPVIRALGAIANQRADSGSSKMIRFASILNCGFTEAAQNHTAQRLLKRFAEKAGLVWAGAISAGSAGAVTKSVRVSLNLLADAMAAGGDLSTQAVEREAKNAVPGWTYRVIGNWMWKRQAKKNGALDQFYARPYT